MRTSSISLRRSLQVAHAARRCRPGRSDGRCDASGPRHVDRADDVHTGPGDIVGARLRVGQDFIGDPLRRDDALIDQFVVQAATGRKPLVGRYGADPAGLLRVDAPGLMVIGYRSHPSTVEQTAEKFTQVPEGRRARGDRSTSGSPRRDRRGSSSSSRAVQRASCSPGPCNPPRAIVRSASRSNSWPRRTPTRRRRARRCPFG